jgi:hypothetical protein
LDCPKDKEGNVTLGGKDTLTCTAKGANLGTITKVKLYSSGQTNSNTQADSAEGDFAPTTGDPSSGKVTFAQSILAGLGGGYKVVLVDYGGIETTTSVALNFSTSPSVSSVTPQKIDLTENFPILFKITGARLNTVAFVVLTSPDGKISDSFKVNATTAASSVSFEMDKTSKIAQVDATTPVNFKLSLKTSEPEATVVDTAQTVTVQPAPKAKPATPKPAAPKPAAHRAASRRP